MMCASPSSQLLPRIFGVRQATGLALQRRTGTLYHLILDLFFVPQNLNLSQNLSYATGFQRLILLCLFSFILFWFLLRLEHPAWWICAQYKTLVLSLLLVNTKQANQGSFFFFF